MMTGTQWLDMVTTSGTRNVRSRCCGRIIFYRTPGDEWCAEHRCTVMTQFSGQCSRRAAYADLCGQHFGQGLREMLAG